MSYFLWIEDFENSPRVTAHDVFGGTVSAEVFSDNKHQLRKKLRQQGVFVELNFQDGLQFIRQNLQQIDYVILDIDLPAYSEDDEINADVLALLENFQDYKKSEDAAEDEVLLAKNCKQLKAIAGFYLYTELVVELGFPKQHILFCSNHAENAKTTRDAFKMAKIALPRIFEKSNPEVQLWVENKASDTYSRLRRGIIEGCQQLKLELANDEQFLQFRDFIKTSDHQVATMDVVNYLDTLAQFFPLKEATTNMTGMQYRLFLRVLAHEWEDNASAENLKGKFGKDLNNFHDIYTFGWTMKLIRNWVSHANLLDPVSSEFIAFSFLINMRAMFHLPKEIQEYEVILLSCITANPVDSVNIETLRTDQKYADEDIDGIVSFLKISEYKEDKNGKEKLNKNGNKMLKEFRDKINAVYRQNTGNPDAEDHDFRRFLFQYFWLNQKKYSDKLISKSDDFLPTLSRHIYGHSFL